MYLGMELYLRVARASWNERQTTSRDDRNSDDGDGDMVDEE